MMLQAIVFDGQGWVFPSVQKVLVKCCSRAIVGKWLLLMLPENKGLGTAKKIKGAQVSHKHPNWTFLLLCNQHLGCSHGNKLTSASSKANVPAATWLRDRQPWVMRELS
jgi:hypothetical protein